MRILIVEDDAEKLRRICQVVRGVAGIRDGMIDDVRDLAGARRALRDNEYNLLILDIAVPQRPEDAPGPYAGVDFLEELEEREGLYKIPQHIVGLTAHEELMSIAGRRFSEALWLVIRYDQSSTQWEQQLQRRVDHILHAGQARRPASTERISTTDLINGGETDSVEFKETLRWNAKGSRDDERLGQATLKTVAAFLNTFGGSLLVGIANDGRVTGLKPDHFADQDQAMLFLSQLIRTRISHGHMRFVKIRVEWIDGKEVMRVDCERATEPAYLRISPEEESFYVRTGPSSTELPVSEVHGYISDWFS